MGSNLDLRKFQDVDSVEDAFGKIVSGKSGYKPVIERRVDPIQCKKCGSIVDGHKNFCPQCGGKLEKKPTSVKCSGCGELFEDKETFCGFCGNKRE
jgi:RNA polymerase subunit RPABC4/transcription elongation factor Spt4